MKIALSPELPKHILFLGDKSQEQMELTDHLELENYIVHHVSRINDALLNLKSSRTEIILLDSSRNEVACLELCHAIKSTARSRKNLVIIASDKQDESSEVAAFRAGADDYITKPVKPMAFVERLKTRMSEPKDSITVQPELNGHSRIHIDRESYSVFKDNKTLNLSRKEFELLFLLAGHPGKIFRREEVFEKVWKKKFEESNRTVDVHILRLRKKLGHEYIQTQKGVGYRFTM
jgi:two-component system alkaline phosphatase synthesis response regulator PhoP